MTTTKNMNKRLLPSTWTQRDDGSWDTDIHGEWTADEEASLDTWLGLIRHMTDHDPVGCQSDRDQAVLAAIGRPEWKAIREGEGFTLAQLGVLVDVDAASISRWETGKRSPDDGDYLNWLRTTDQAQARRAQWSVFGMILKRGGWLQSDKTLPDLIDEMWETVWKPGGLFDRWAETGTLPTWTPADAGYTS